MNSTSHTDEPYGGEGLNQSPNPYSSDLTFNADFNGRANKRHLRVEDPNRIEDVSGARADDDAMNLQELAGRGSSHGRRGDPAGAPSEDHGGSDGSRRASMQSKLDRAKQSFLTFGKFVGPGFMIAVAYSKSHQHAFSADILHHHGTQYSLLLQSIPETMPLILLPEHRTASGCSSSSC